MRALFGNVSETLEGANTRFVDMHQRDVALLESLSRGIETLSGLDDTIQLIRDDSMEMELISLNAMTVALKSGAAGKAFSVITDELKRLSGRTIALTEQLTNNGRSLLDQFSKFRNDVHALEQKQSVLFSGLEERIRAAFAAFEAQVRELATALGNLLSTAQGIAAPVRRTMETVQVHDIFRQSLEHVVLVLSAEEDEEAPGEDEHLRFRRSITDLAASLIADAASLLRDSRISFDAGVSEASRLIQEGDESRRVILDDQLAKDGAMMRAFAGATETLHLLRRDVEDYMRLKHTLSTLGGRLATSVSSLDDQFRDFSKIITRFKTIDIASRIEVAKQASLMGMRDTVGEMSDLTEKIHLDVENALSSTRSFIDDTTAAIASYGENSEEETGLVLDSIRRISDIHGRLSLFRDSIISGVDSFRLFTPEFIASIAGSKDSVSALTDIENRLATLQLTIEKDRSDAEDELRSRAVPEASWAVTSERLRAVIERFTIYAHKQVAAELGGFSVEGGVETGEVTFF